MSLVGKQFWERFPGYTHLLWHGTVERKVKAEKSGYYYVSYAGDQAGKLYTRKATTLKKLIEAGPTVPSLEFKVGELVLVSDGPKDYLAKVSSRDLSCVLCSVLSVVYPTTPLCAPRALLHTT